MLVRVRIVDICNRHQGDIHTAVTAELDTNISQKLATLAKDNDEIMLKVAVGSTKPLPLSKGVRSGFNVFVDFYLAVSPMTRCYDATKSADERNQQLRSSSFRFSKDDQPDLEEEAMRKFEDVARQGFNKLNFVEKLGAIACDVISCTPLRYRDFFVPYLVTVPLNSIAKAIKIVGDIWENGCSYIVARPTTGNDADHIRTPVVRTWISNPNFMELAESNLKVAKKLRWISHCVAGNTDAANWIGQLIAEYWGCDISSEV